MSETPDWLDDQEMALWRAFIEVSSGVAQKLDAALKADAKLSFEDYEVLVHLSESAEERLRMTDLSDRLLHSQSRLTQRVDRLSARGLVVRERSDEDRRVVFTVLTNEGRRTLAKAAPDHLIHVRRHLIDLIEPEELTVVLGVYQRLIHQLRSPEIELASNDEHAV